jgi:hypothetical protein
MPTIKMVDAAKFYKGLPGQVEAFQLLDKILTEEQKTQFQDLYRKAPPVPVAVVKQDIYLYCNWSGKYDDYGLKVFGLYLMNGDRVVDKLVVCSGQAYAQDVAWPPDDYSGSMRPCPEGVYDIGAVDDLGYDPGASDGYGQWVVPIEPRFPLQRSLLRLHSDRNGATSPGSAGCICPYFEKDMYILVKWLRAKSKPTYLIVDHGLGYLSKQGVKVPVLKK